MYIYVCAFVVTHLEDKANSSDQDNSSDDELFSNFQFAPDDIETKCLSSPKSNLFGLGYVGLSHSDIFGISSSRLGDSHLKYKEKNKSINIRGQVRIVHVLWAQLSYSQKCQFV